MSSVPVWDCHGVLWLYKGQEEKSFSRKRSVRVSSSAGSADTTEWLACTTQASCVQPCLRIRILLKSEALVPEPFPHRSEFNWCGQHWNHGDFFNPLGIWASSLSWESLWRITHLNYAATLVLIVLVRLQLCRDLLFTIWPGRGSLCWNHWWVTGCCLC